MPKNRTINLHIGVKNLSFAVGKCLLKLSFEITGNFLAAAQNDSLKDTVDYDALSRYLESRLSGLSCGQSHQINNSISTALSEFSPLISKHCFETKILCSSDSCHENTRL